MATNEYPTMAYRVTFRALNLNPVHRLKVLLPFGRLCYVMESNNDASQIAEQVAAIWRRLA